MQYCTANRWNDRKGIAQSRRRQRLGTRLGANQDSETLLARAGANTAQVDRGHFGFGRVAGALDDTLGSAPVQTQVCLWRCNLHGHTLDITDQQGCGKGDCMFICAAAGIKWSILPKPVRLHARKKCSRRFGTAGVHFDMFICEQTQSGGILFRCVRSLWQIHSRRLIQKLRKRGVPDQILSIVDLWLSERKPE